MRSATRLLDAGNTTAKTAVSKDEVISLYTKPESETLNRCRCGFTLHLRILIFLKLASLFLWLRGLYSYLRGLYSISVAQTSINITFGARIGNMCGPMKFIQWLKIGRAHV